MSEHRAQVYLESSTSRDLNMNLELLVDLIEENIGQVGASRSDHEGSLARLGGQVNDVFVRDGGGEYDGLSVKLLEVSYPLLTIHNVELIAHMLKNDRIIETVQMLGLRSIDELYYSLWRWINQLVRVPDDLRPDQMYPELDSDILRVRNDAIRVPIEVVAVGINRNTNAPAVPEDWLGRRFESGEEMHREMDQFRVGKAPTTYAVTYGMILEELPDIYDQLPEDTSGSIWIIDRSLRSTQYSIPEYLENHSESNRYLVSNDQWIGFDESILEISEGSSIPSDASEMLLRLRSESSGVLSSMLQKAIRRGASELMYDILTALNDRPNYNLPDMGFKRVSSSRQCVWRLFISALEDVTMYVADESVISLTTLALLSIITNNLLEYRFSDSVMGRIIETSEMYCMTPYHTDFRRFRGTVEYHSDPLNLVLDHMPMMSGDREMIESYRLLDPSEYITLGGHREITDLNDVILSSFDHHCRPDIILIFQGLMDRIRTTRQVSQYIWDISSVINYRNDQSPDFSNPDLILLRDIQRLIYWEPMESKIIPELPQYQVNDIGLFITDRREAFLTLFGIPYRHGSVDYMLAGNEEAPLKIKLGSSWNLTSDLSLLEHMPRRIIDLRDIKPPIGYRWIADEVESRWESGKYLISFNDEEISMDLFDGSRALIPIAPEQPTEPSPNSSVFSVTGHRVEEVLKYRSDVYETLTYLQSPSDLNSELAILTYTKLFNGGTNEVVIGPIDRHGNRTESSINLQLEGRLWVIFSYLSWLYPDAVSLDGLMRFKINTSSPQYLIIVEELEDMLREQTGRIESIPEIITPLWNHQISSVDTIYQKILEGGHGMGDASDVGAGKTLTSLALGVRLMSAPREFIEGHQAILVLVPNRALISTWTSEIEKHTEGYHVLTHTARSKVTVDQIRSHSIIISALNTMRDHPIRNPWILTIIDECLSVQNSGAQWTEEAWKQSLISLGVVLLSATFFRSRYNKLYYMLGMFQSNLPTNREYLPTILNERIVVHKQLDTHRVWNTSTTYIPFPESIRPEYDRILSSDQSDQNKYRRLQSLLNTQREYVAEHIRPLIEGVRAVIYVSGDEEARIFSETLGLPIYGTRGLDVSSQESIIATINKASVGVNDLIHFDSIVLRPPAPDLLPQIKGRLDRPGQENTELNLRYFMIQDSIDIGLELRMQVADNFMSNYIMPMAEFYSLSLQ